MNKKLIKRSIILFSLAIFLVTSCEQPVQVKWPEVTRESKPWTRWWWMGSAVDEKNLDKQLTQMDAAGIGGVEITPIYGAKGYEDKFIEYLSPQWMEMLNYTIKRTSELGIGVDINNGTGWPFGGPQVTPENAASMLVVQKYSLKAGEKLSNKIVAEDPRQKETGAELQALVGYNTNGEIEILTGKVLPDGTLDWIPQEGSWELYAAFNGRTLQQVKRAASGGEGFTMDHYSKDALKQYLTRFDNAFGEENPAIRCYFNDSYEVYNTTWTNTFFEEFQNRRGYDLKPYLRELTSTETNETVQRVKTDYRETISDILLENFTKPWTDWTHQKGSLSRNQAHGSPANLIDLYAAVDIPECEVFGSSNFEIPGLRRDTDDQRNIEPDPTMLKLASSAAHIKGNNLISCETFTWKGEHFKVSLAQCKPEVEEVFLSGINHVFFHGTTYSPEEAEWPGWLFYASTNFAPSNSFWSHLNGLTNYITRCQSVLQAGNPDNELLVYWPVFDIWNDADGLMYQISVHNVNEWLHYPQIKKLGKKGYGYDFISDRLLQNTKVDGNSLQTNDSAARHKVLIIPQAKFIPLKTFKKIIDLAKQGAIVIMESLPNDVPGLQNLEERRNELASLKNALQFSSINENTQECNLEKGKIILTQNLSDALLTNNIEREKLVDTGLKFIRRSIDKGSYYYIVNHTSETIDSFIPLNKRAKSVVILDPQSGSTGLADFTIKEDKIKVHVQLESGEALILQTSESKLNLPKWPYISAKADPFPLAGDWKIEFTQGGPVLPKKRNLSELVSWTEMDEETSIFSGSALYSINFEWKENSFPEYLLKLGQVNESAHVWLNDNDLGYLWAIPFQTKVGKFLKQGTNNLKIEVANLMANRIIDLDKKGIEWRKFHEINFVKIKYEPFDASTWSPMPSGLIGPVELIPVQINYSKQ